MHPLILFFLLHLPVCACDLNHDWKVLKSSANIDVQTSALNSIIEELVSTLGGRFMLLEVKDSFARKGEADLSHPGSTPGSALSTPEIARREQSLMALPSTEFEVWGRNGMGTSLQSVYDAKGLQKLAQQNALTAYLRIRLKRYAKIQRHAKDNYEHNPHVYRDSVEHQIALSYAVIGTRGEYLSFGDFQRSYEEFEVYQNLPSQERIDISRARYTEDGTELLETQYYFGLEEVQQTSQWLAEFMESRL